MPLKQGHAQDVPLKQKHEVEWALRSGGTVACRSYLPLKGGPSSPCDSPQATPSILSLLPKLLETPFLMPKPLNVGKILSNVCALCITISRLGVHYRAVVHTFSQVTMNLPAPGTPGNIYKCVQVVGPKTPAVVMPLETLLQLNCPKGSKSTDHGQWMKK